MYYVYGMVEFLICQTIPYTNLYFWHPHKNYGYLFFFLPSEDINPYLAKVENMVSS